MNIAKNLVQSRGFLAKKRYLCTANASNDNDCMEEKAQFIRFDWVTR